MAPAKKKRVAHSTAVDFVIRRAADTADTDWCARLMAGSEPWITLGRDHTACLKLVTNSEKELYVGVLSGELAGFVLLDLHGGLRGYIQSIGVAPNLRSRGLGSKLLHFAEQRILRETPNVFMCVSSFNRDAERLYLRLGYTRVGELTDFIIPGASEILLRKAAGSMAKFNANDTRHSEKNKQC